MDILELTLIKNIKEEYVYGKITYTPSIRSVRALLKEDIIYIGDLVQKTEKELLQFTNFGYKSLNEIKELLRSFNLELGIKYTDKWEELRKVAPMRYKFILLSKMIKNSYYKDLYEHHDSGTATSDCRSLGLQVINAIAEKEPWYQVGMFEQDANASNYGL
jgi:hypothetical protein